jgi:hypothetical protein
MQIFEQIDLCIFTENAERNCAYLANTPNETAHIHSVSEMNCANLQIRQKYLKIKYLAMVKNILRRALLAKKVDIKKSHAGVLLINSYWRT